MSEQQAVGENFTRKTSVSIALITPEEAALKLRLSNRTVRRMIQDGRLPGGVRIGNKWMIVSCDFQRYFQSTVSNRLKNDPNQSGQIGH
jgi:excisionase family DNA binding protein